MKKIAVLSLILFCVYFQFIKAQQNIDTSIIVNTQEHKLSVCIPSDYDALNSYPLIIGLHYCTGSGDEYRLALQDICDSLNMIVACPDNDGDEMTDPAFILATLDTAISMFSINQDEVYLTGMSCNGKFATIQGLAELYPFKGVFPWVPWITSFNATSYNLDSEVPIVLAVGTLDQNFNVIYNLYDTLQAHDGNSNFLMVPGIGHALGFATFSDEMIRCIKYLNDEGGITISPIDNRTMENNDPPLVFKVEIDNQTGEEINIKAISSKASLIANPTVGAIQDDSVTVTLLPVENQTGTAIIILEASTEDQTNIEQVVFKVKINAAVSSIRKINSGTTSFEIYPMPAKENIYFNSRESNLFVQIHDVTGKIVMAGRNIDTSLPLNIASLNKGIYFLTAKNDSGDKIVKIIKE